MTQSKADRVKIVALDVRGTIIHPYDDEPVDIKIAETIWDLLRNGTSIGIVTATSLASLQFLFIPQLLDVLSSDLDKTVLDRITFYVDSGTLAYKLGVDGQAVPLNGFPTAAFRPDQRDTVLEGIKFVRRKHAWASETTKTKTGQINFYSGGAFEKRLDLASSLRDYFHLTGAGEIFVMVPSAKDTVDIALRDKSFAIGDLIGRNPAATELYVVGDSLQDGGADHDMLIQSIITFPYQVGPFKPGASVEHLEGYGPDGAHDALQRILYDREKH